jgi:hypothetical protein
MRMRIADMLTQQEAHAIAQAFVGALLEAQIVTEIPALYNFDPDAEFLFRVHDPHTSCVGASRYVAVAKNHGVARDAGRAGE